MILFSRKVFLLGLIFLAALLAGAWLMFGRSQATPSLLSLPDYSSVDWQLEGEPLRVEVVNTEESVAQGLSGRTGLDGIDGMLFVFDQSAVRTFWMKEMLFAIDIVWINNGEIVGIESNVQPPKPGMLDSEIERRTSPASVDMVLETNPGRL